MIQPIKQVKWRSLVSEQEESGQAVAAFCRMRELHESQFYYWRKRLQEVATHPTWPPQESGDQMSEKSVRRGMARSFSSLRGAKTCHLCGQWRQGATLTRMTVALSAGQMYAAERRHTPKWKFRIEGFPHAKALRAERRITYFLSN